MASRVSASRSPTSSARWPSTRGPSASGSITGTVSSVQVEGPGPHDVIAFELDPSAAGRRAGITHFGFRLIRPEDIDAAVTDCLGAGGSLLRRGEFSPGFPFAYIADPDGYEIELWFE